MLRQLPRTVLNEAENEDEPWSWLARWVKRNPVEWWSEGPALDYDAECKRYERAGFKRTAIGVYSASAAARLKTKICEVHFYFHKNDANKRLKRIIMDAGWPMSFRKTFEAASSQQKVYRTLTIISRGGGSISGTYHDKLLAANERGDREAVAHWADKQIAAILGTKDGREWLLQGKTSSTSPKAPDEATREYARAKYEKFIAADARRLGRKKADDKWKGTKIPQFKLESNGAEIAAAMATGWLVGGRNGFPGLCFMSDEVLAQLLGHTLPLKSLQSSDQGWKIVRTIRERIGLKKAEILFNGIKKVGDKQWAILDRCGTQTHWISLRPSKPLPPKL